MLSCDGSTMRRLYLAYAWIALFVYPIGKPPHTRGDNHTKTSLSI